MLMKEVTNVRRAISDWPTFAATSLPHLSVRRSFPVDNTIGTIFAILTLIVSVLSVIIAWAMWRLKLQEDRLRREGPTSTQATEDLEQQRIGTGHDGNSHEEDDQEGDNDEGNDN